jgi:Transcription factor WhiB
MRRDALPDLQGPTAPPTATAAWLELTHVLEQVGTVPCRTGDAAAWWPDARQVHSPPTRAALDACRRCPAAAPCLAYAMAADERYGIWGGTTPDERRALRWASDSP